MRHSTENPAFKATDNFNDHTSHALLVSAFNKARSLGFFHKIEQTIHLKM
jgi:hypothetical protein